MAKVLQSNIPLASFGTFSCQRYVKKDLKAAFAPTESEVKRFRQLVVNIVLATDIMDWDLKALRNNHWDKEFDEQVANASPKDTADRKVTIVLAHLIQASDIAHASQHWHIK